MSKRYLKRMVDEGYVSGWDDPRMPTICGLRRKGYTKGAIRRFCSTVGVAKSNSTVEPGDIGALPKGGPKARRPAPHGRAGSCRACH